LSGKPRAWRAQDVEGLYVVATRNIDGIEYGCQVLPRDQTVTSEEPLDTLSRFQPQTKFVPCDPPREGLGLPPQGSPPVFPRCSPRPWRGRAEAAQSRPARPASPLPSDHDARMARALLSLDGLSVGDAFGAAIFDPANPDSLHRPRPLPKPPWRWTDDTVMAT